MSTRLPHIGAGNFWWARGWDPGDQVTARAHVRDAEGPSAASILLLRESPSIIFS